MEMKISHLYYDYCSTKNRFDGKNQTRNHDRKSKDVFVRLSSEFCLGDLKEMAICA